MMPLAMKLHMPSRSPIQPRMSSFACVRPSQRGDRHGPVPTAEEQDGPQPGNGENRRVLGHEENHPAEARILGQEAGHQFALGLGQVERGAIRARHGARAVHEERDEDERSVQKMFQFQNQPA